MVQLEAPESLLQSVKSTTAVFDSHLTDALHCAISMLEAVMTVNKRAGDMNCLNFFPKDYCLVVPVPMFPLSSKFLSTIGKVNIWNVRKTSERSWLPQHQVSTPWDGQIFADHDRASSDGVQPQENASLENDERCVEWPLMLKMADEINEEAI
jgi:hypothetical protein